MNDFAFGQDVEYFNEQNLKKQYGLPRAVCNEYDPLSAEEGRCGVSGTTVCRTAGCNLPDKCDELKRFLQLKR